MYLYTEDGTEPGNPYTGDIGGGSCTLFGNLI